MAAACGLLQGLSAGQVIADRAYDAHQLPDAISTKAASLSFPPAAIADISTLTTKSLMEPLGIEGFFAKITQWRRIATRYDKLAATFLGFVKLASIILSLK